MTIIFWEALLEQYRMKMKIEVWGVCGGTWSWVKASRL